MGDLYDENGIPWALSADPSSPINLPEARNVRVFLNGDRIKNVTWADRRAGRLTCYADKQPSPESCPVNLWAVDEDPEWCMCGKVEFQLADGRRG